MTLQVPVWRCLHRGSYYRRPQQTPTLWEETLLLGAGPTGERSGPPPRLAVEGRSSGHGPMLPISDVDKVKPMLLPHGGWPMAAGPVSRLGSFEPGDKTGLRLSPHLAPSTTVIVITVLAHPPSLFFRSGVG